MTKILLSIILIISTLHPVWAKDIEVTVYSDDSYAPYSYKKGRHAAGIYTEIMEIIFSRMKGYRVSIVPVPWKRGLKLLEEGKGFALYPPYKYPEKRPYIELYSNPIIKEKVVLVCRHGSLEKTRVNWPEDYEGLTIGLNRGFSLGGKKFWEAVHNGTINVEETENNKMNLMKLLKGRIDCYLNDHFSIMWTLNNMRKNNEVPTRVSDVIRYSTFVSNQQGYLGITGRDQGKFPFKKDFLAQFNKILQELKNDGSIDTIINNFLEENDAELILPAHPCTAGQ